MVTAAADAAAASVDLALALFLRFLDTYSW
jgi:hypothetical protein